MHFDSFVQIGVLLSVATVVSFVMRFLKQPLIIGHIITGFFVGRYALGLFHDQETLELFSRLGIAFLLFSVGLGLNPKVLKEYGLASVLNTFGQVFLTGGAGVLLCLVLGYDWVTSLYVGVAISFSSTVIVLKLLADKGDLEKLYVKVSIGSLLLQDLIAIILLFMIPILTGSAGDGKSLWQTLALGVAATVGVFGISHYGIRYLHRYLTRSQELLFLFANAWAIGIAIVFSQIGFSVEGGALLAGVSLSHLPSSHEMSARLTPLRDFFIVTFFILLGTQMVVSDFLSILFPAAVLSIFVLLINPLIQMIIMGVLGYRKKTSFQTGMMAAQISEFSLILVGLGVSLKQVAPSVLSTVTLVGIVTIFISTYLISYSDKIYLWLAPLLGIFERKHVRERAVRAEKFPVVVIGSGRVSYDFIHFLKKENAKFTVLEHDPDALDQLDRQEVHHKYGDASDPDLLEDMKLSQAKMVICSVPDFSTSLTVLSVTKRHGDGPFVACVAHSIHNALALYDAGADYVILPHFLGGKYAASLLRKQFEDSNAISSFREKHISQLQERLEYGHEHPHIERML